jgi:hypothetical protein
MSEIRKIQANPELATKKLKKLEQKLAKRGVVSFVVGVFVMLILLHSIDLPQ